MERLSTALCIFICLSGVYRYSSAALIKACANDAACHTTGGDANAVCLPANGHGVCVCKTTHKDDGSGTCVPKANTECPSQSQVCSDGTSKVCTCITGHSYNGSKCVVGHGDVCTAVADCTGLNLKCDKSENPNKCACKDDYSQDGANCIKAYKCKLLRLADKCSVPSDCAAVTHATCTGTTCQCETAYKAVSKTCVARGLAETCSSTSECAAITYAVCASTTCQCVPAYKKANGSCVAKGHGDPCKANTDCTGQSQECSGDASSQVCTCIAGHSFVGKICVVVGHGEACIKDADCTGLNLKCDTSKSAHVCACKDGFSQDGVNCVKGYGDVCTANEDCTGQNLECNDSDPKACACKSGYSKDGVNCIKVPGSSAVVTSMAFPVAIALLSITLFGKLC